MAAAPPRRRLILALLLLLSSLAWPAVGWCSSSRRCIRRNARFGASPSKDPSLNQQQTTWLVVGDGDLSYSALLADEAKERGIHLIASVWEDQETHQRVYRHSEHHAATIAGHDDCTVLYQVDATKLEERFAANSLDRILFNFPHVPGKANVGRNRQLLHDVFRSARHVLKRPHGQIHIALLHGQSGVEASSVLEWRHSWMSSMYAAEHGFLLQRVEPFTVQYNVSSYRGHDRPFATGDQPRRSVYGFCNGAIPEAFQMACRHELHIRLDPMEMESCGYSPDELVKGDVVPALARQVAPEGIRVEAPVRDIVTPAGSSPLLVFLIVYSGASMPLTRNGADRIRADLETAVTERLGLSLAKGGRRVSKPFPYPLLNVILNDFSLQ